MAASLDDILTTQKNGVIGINNISQSLAGLYSYAKGTTLSAGPASTGAYATLFTVPTGRQATITDIEICNTGTTAATFYISLCAVGETASASNALFYGAPISPNSTVQWSGQQAVDAGGFIAAYASSASVTFKVGGGLA